MYDGRREKKAKECWFGVIYDRRWIVVKVLKVVGDNEEGKPLYKKLLVARGMNRS